LARRHSPIKVGGTMLKIEKRESYWNRTKTRGGPPNDC
jgi:hypothetical protein